MDIEVARNTFRKNEFTDRPEMLFVKNLAENHLSDVVFDSYGQRWEALRRVTHAAVLNYAKTDKLIYLASDCVENTIKLILDREGTGKPFNPYPYVYHLFSNILANSAFGRGYDSIDDKEYVDFKSSTKDQSEKRGFRNMLWQMSGLFRWLDSRKYRQVFDKTMGTIDTIRQKFLSHYDGYVTGVCRDFCDALISAKIDALRDRKESARYLTDNNLSMVIWDWFLAGTDTSQTTFQWILLLIANYPRVQQRLRDEIWETIGDRIAIHDDRHRCHYTLAVIAETLRFRNPVPMGLFHATGSAVQLFGNSGSSYWLPEKQRLFVCQWHIMNSDKYWQNADHFLPERFLDNDGHYTTTTTTTTSTTTRSKAYIPFGVGRRQCLGEKLAIADLFLVLVRFLQLTENYDIVVVDNCQQDLDPNPNDFNNFQPNKHEIDLLSNEGIVCLIKRQFLINALNDEIVANFSIIISQSMANSSVKSYLNKQYMSRAVSNCVSIGPPIDPIVRQTNANIGANVDGLCFRFY
ncbi:uncharacterized protein LOC128963668 [Oppia nitens]|uniref:uncharacterized protein LOC128963668 n=1 Tax=Oppia nitens TaxID=1686743 RepID=UPI0023DADC55|nr:uncharacterized protein LOC128963668 [Oppia nitens]